MAASLAILTPHEKYWVDLQPFLLECGYQLRPRYRPEWQPSWLQPGNFVRWSTCEDSLRTFVSMVIRSAAYSVFIANRYYFLCAGQKPDMLDAIRIADGSKVVLKCILAGGNEHRTISYFSSLEMRSYIRNRTVPVIQFIALPSTSDVLLVMPYLRQFDTPPFHRCSEVLDALRQFLQVK